MRIMARVLLILLVLVCMSNSGGHASMGIKYEGKCAMRAGHVHFHSQDSARMLLPGVHEVKRSCCRWCRQVLIAEHFSSDAGHVCHISRGNQGRQYGRFNDLIRSPYSSNPLLTVAADKERDYTNLQFIDDWGSHSPPWEIAHK